MITIGGLTVVEAQRLLEMLEELRCGPVIGLPEPIGDLVRTNEPPPFMNVAERREAVGLPPVITFATLLQRITTERVAGTKIAEVLGGKMLPAIATDSDEIRRVYDELFGGD